jgi:hypothetical protein
MISPAILQSDDRAAFARFWDDHFRPGLTARILSVRLSTAICSRGAGADLAGCAEKNPLPIILPISRNPLFFYGASGYNGYN